MKLSYLLVLLPCVTWGQHQFSLENPPSQVELLGEGFLSTDINERDFAMSPDGREIYFTVSTPGSSLQTIVSSTRTSSGWTAPEVVSFAGHYSDLEPAFSPDGKTLFFSSNRPITGTAAKDFDIWRVHRTDVGWGTPENLGTVVNKSGNEFFPSVAANGNLYFTAAYTNGVGEEDIHMARLTSSGYQTPMPLDTMINSKTYEFNAFIAPDERYIIFSSYGRSDDTGGGDLYISFKDEKGNWKPSQNLKGFNSSRLDYCPYVSGGGKVFVFTSERHQLPSTFPQAPATYRDIRDYYKTTQNGTGNLYWVDFRTLLDMHKAK